jgi:hypothetical protein
MGLPGKITAQGSAVRSTDAPLGAPLTVILNGKRIFGTLDGPPRTDRHSAVPETA